LDAHLHSLGSFSVFFLSFFLEQTNSSLPLESSLESRRKSRTQNAINIRDLLPAGHLFSQILIDNSIAMPIVLQGCTARESQNSSNAQETSESCCPEISSPFVARSKTPLIVPRYQKPNLHETRMPQLQKIQKSITPSAPPCLSSSVACRPFLVQHSHLAPLPHLFPHQQRTDPSSASSTRAISRTESCFLRSNLVA